MSTQQNNSFDVQEWTQKAKAHTGADKVLGALCHWGVDKSVVVRDPVQFRKDWIAAGLPAKVVPTKVNFRTALARGVKNYIRDKKKGLGANQKYLAEITEESPNQLIYTIDVLDTDRGLNLKGSTLEAKLDKRTGILTCTDMDLVHEFNTYKPIFINTDLQKICMTFVKWCSGVQTLKNSGLYFVPEGVNTKELTLGADFLNQTLGPTMVCWPVADLDSAKQAAWQALQNELNVEMAEFELEVQDDLNNKKSMRRDTMLRRMEQLEELKSKTDLYARSLNRTAQRELERIEKLAGTVSDLVLKSKTKKKDKKDQSQEGDTHGTDTNDSGSSGAEAGQPANEEL